MNGYFPPIVLGARPVQYRMCFTVGEHSAHHIRRILRSYLDEWGMPELADAVELGVTELLANIVRHVPDRRCTLLILRSASGVRVEVTDRSSELPVLRDDMSPDAIGGRGLVLVNAVADKWGVGRWSDGKTVWFECRSGAEERSA